MELYVKADFTEELKEVQNPRDDETLLMEKRDTLSAVCPFCGYFNEFENGTINGRACPHFVGAQTSNGTESRVHVMLFARYENE